jgi:acyl-CoA synthetase (NDP forming)
VPWPLLPPPASTRCSPTAVSGPVDTTATVSQAGFTECLELAAADPGVEAELAAALPTAATGDLTAAICAARIPVPLAAVLLDQPETVRLLPRRPGQPGAIPAYAYPESAARALGHAAAYGSWRARPAEPVAHLARLQGGRARAVIRSFLETAPPVGWLPPGPAAELLACYGIPLARARRARSRSAAARAATELGWPVVLKADVAGLVHKSDAGAVKLGLLSSADVRAAYGELAATSGDRLAGVLVQEMITGGTEVIVGATQDPVFGPVVVFGLGGVATEVLGDHITRLAPLTGANAAEMIHGIHAAALLAGYRGAPPADPAGLRDLLLRVSRLADDLPEVAELDLNPVIARPERVVTVDARIRVSPAELPDPFLRRLR